MNNINHWINDICIDNEAPPSPQKSRLFSMFSRIWNKPIIKVDKQGEICPENFEEPLPEDFESFQLGDTPTEDYDQMLFSGSCFTGNKLINKENEVLDKYKCDYQTHNHDDLCETHDKPINDDK